MAVQKSEPHVLSWPSSSTHGVGSLCSCPCWELGRAKDPLPPPGSWWHLGPEPPLPLRGECEQMAAPGPPLHPREGLASLSGILQILQHFFLVPDSPCNSRKWTGLAYYNPCSIGQEPKT